MRVVETPEYLELKQVYNKFANKYGYPEATARTYDELVRESRKLLNRHNTFFRGVAMEEGLIERTPGMSSYERLKHAATQTYDGRTHLWVSPYSDYAGFYAGDNGGVFALRPQIKFDGKPIS